MRQIGRLSIFCIFLTELYAESVLVCAETHLLLLTFCIFLGIIYAETKEFYA